METPFNYNNMNNLAGFLTIPYETAVNYALQRCNLPAIRLPKVENPYLSGIAKHAGETPLYDELVLDFLLDEDNEVRDSLMDWLLSGANSNSPLSTYRDITLHIKNKNHETIKQYLFVGAHITDIETVSFDTATIDADVQVCSVTFAYQYYKRIK